MAKEICQDAETFREMAEEDEGREKYYSVQRG